MSKDQEKGDEVLRRLLKTPPDPGHKSRTSDSGQKTKPGGTPAQKHRPEEDS
ncbi:hypothetical protein [Hoeflea sp.]|uniref:hypothetical protein n=1 Tax=Hoeflea sp. TaxID=1940281 RepID=UPI003BAEEFF0